MNHSSSGWDGQNGNSKRGAEAVMVETGTNPGFVDCTEQRRLNEARETAIPWKKWGHYLSDRQWGTVREAYSQDGR
jgi:hypothetical protein